MNIAKELRELADRVEQASIISWECVEHHTDEQNRPVLGLRHPAGYYFLYVVEGTGFDERSRLRRLAEFLNDKGWK